jgi:flagellar FliJ protein
MKFRFRLETLLRHRKLMQDEAQRIYADAQKAVQDQLARIKEMYADLDEARIRSEVLQKQGGTCAPDLVQIEEYINGQKIRIQLARNKARELMQIAEEKLEILTEKMQEHKLLEKLKEKKREEYRRERNKDMQKENDDLALMRFDSKEPA